MLVLVSIGDLTQIRFLDEDGKGLAVIEDRVRVVIGEALGPSYFSS